MRRSMLSATGSWRWRHCSANSASDRGVQFMAVSQMGKSYYSVITWSAHSISDTNIVGLPNFAP
jgi:hypothetical protein